MYIISSREINEYTIIYRVGPNRISIYTPYKYVPYMYVCINKFSPYPYSYTPYVNFSRCIYTPYNTYI